MAELAFFIGKGGVGKTTIASAYAARLAERHRRQRILLLSTDPAHSLADIFALPRAASPMRPARMAKAAGDLWYWQVDAEQQMQRFLGQHRRAILQVLESGTFFSRAEIEPLLSSALPGMAEMAGLLAIDEALQSRRFARIVVDTAPLGHTLRLFAMPQHFLRFLDFLHVAASRDRVLAAHFAGASLPSQGILSDLEQVVARIQRALTAPDSRTFLVTTPENFSLQEAARGAASLREMGSEVRITDAVVNRAMVKSGGRCPSCATRRAATAEAVRFLHLHFKKVPVWMAQEAAAPVMGAAELARFGAHIFEQKVFDGSRRFPPEAEAPRLQTAGWPALEAPLTLTLGKGGVGKTTVSAGLALCQRALARKTSIAVCSTDPAPSLDDIFQKSIGDSLTPVLGDRHLQAAEFDAEAGFRRWAETTKEKIGQAFSHQTAGVHLDLSFDRRLIEALLDIVPPGVDELFAIFRLLDLLESAPARQQKLVLDMAPTGHALELLRMPERMLGWSRLLLRILAHHRGLALAQDLAVEIAELSQRVRKLAAMLKDRRKAQAAVVMLAEPLPDRQTARLISELNQLKVHMPAVFVNRVRMEESRCRHCQIARRWQLHTLAGLRDRLKFRGEIFVIPNFPGELAGRRGLQSLIQEIWRLEARQVAKPRARKRKT